MKELSTKGVEELEKFKNRVARLYGMNRISLEDFTRVHDKVTDLIDDCKNIREEE